MAIVRADKATIENYRDLRDYLNSCSDEQLTSPVVLWGPECAAKIESVEPLECDYINPSGEGVEPITEYQDDDSVDLSTEPVVMANGSLILWTENITTV